MPAAGRRCRAHDFLPEPRPGRAGGVTSLFDWPRPALTSSSCTRRSSMSSGEVDARASRAPRTASASADAVVGSPPNSTPAASRGRVRGRRAVHHRGHLVGERALRDSALGRAVVLVEQRLRSRPAAAARASSGRCRPSGRRSAPRTGGTGTARCAPGRATPRRRPTCRTSSRRSWSSAGG